MLRAVLYGHRSESAVVHGFQKGYFTTGDGKRCDPFTITDAHSRYLIRCQIVSRMDLSQVRAICEAAMREYGVPARIRTDNGAPFAGTGPHEGLNNQVPASAYIPSSVRMPRKVPEFTYPKGFFLRRVNNSGDIGWHKARIFISEVFRFEGLGVELISPEFY